MAVRTTSDVFNLLLQAALPKEQADLLLVGSAGQASYICFDAEAHKAQEQIIEITKTTLRNYEMALNLGKIGLQLGVKIIEDQS